MAGDGASTIPLTIAIATYGHTAALKRGAVPIRGVQPAFVEVTPIIAAFRRMVRDVAFDVCEMAPATYMAARAAGAPFKALPIPVFRRFHHAGFVVRRDAGIRAPRDLEGKRAGVRAWSVTTGVWTRGILADEHGLDLSRIGWVVDDEEHVGTVRLPANVQPAPDGRSLADLWADGYLSAAFTANAGIGRVGAPTAQWRSVAGVAVPEHHELFPDAAARERDWFGRTGLYPIHGVIVVKDAVLAEHPEVAGALLDAFAESKRRYLADLVAGTTSFDTDAHYRAMQAIVGPDPLPYGLEENRRSIDALIRYCVDQQILPGPVTADDMFVDPAS